MYFRNIITSNNVDKYIADYYNAIRFIALRYFLIYFCFQFPDKGWESGLYKGIRKTTKKEIPPCGIHISAN